MTPRWRIWLRENSGRLRTPAIWLAWLIFLMLPLLEGARDYEARANLTRPAGLVYLFALSSAVPVLFQAWLASRVSTWYPLRRGRLREALGMHFLGAYALCIPLALRYWAGVLLDFKLTGKQYGYTAETVAMIGTYFGMVLFIHLGRYVMQVRRSEEATLLLKAELSDAAKRRMQADVRALKSELSPRFLVDAFDTVATLVRGAPDRAEQSLANLGDVVRAAVQRGYTREVPLREELDGLQPFVELERARLGGGLQVEMRVTNDAFEAFVPDMILQPIVSTLLARPTGAGRVQLVIAARRGDDRETLDLVVTRSSVVAADPPQRGGADFIDRANIQSRLSRTYGPAVRLELMEATSVTMAIRLVVPWREEPAAIEPQDEAPRHEPRRGRDWIPSAVAVLVFVGGWPLIYSGYMRSITATFGEDGLPRWFAFFASGLTAVVLTLTIVTAVEMSRRFPWWDRSLSTGRKLLAHIGAALAMAGVHLAVKAALIFGPDLVVVNTPSHWAKIAREIAWSPIIAYVQATAVLFIVTGVWRRVRADREALRVRAEMNEAERRRAESELRALQAELNPHFLGNALHTVASLIRTAPDEAVQLLHELQHLLRVPMGRSGTPEITLAEELALLEPYLAVERARIRRPLDVSWMVDQDALRGRVPQMILQPLVENAVKHGFARDGETARIEVAARRVGTRLEVSVSDDGAGLTASRNASRNGNGVGVSNTRARLRELYGDQATLELAARDEGGTVARISVPWREVVV